MKIQSHYRIKPIVQKSNVNNQLNRHQRSTQFQTALQEVQNKFRKNNKESVNNVQKNIK